MNTDQLQTKHAGGRPTKYKPEYNEQAYKLCLLGATDEEMASFFEVNEDTINEWKKVHSKFSESLKDGKGKADADVAESLYKRACGYEHNEDKVFHHPGAKRKKDRIVIVPTIKHYPPDTAAAFIWLKNRAGWSDKQEHEHSGSVEHTFPPEVLDIAKKMAESFAQEVE